ncbi:hypothetical protein GOODEAATRI_023379 [Goodea atripinnis]|uniref:Secreted protein n=1 Tax=Goodea atripinnis TaxID=208336 RepID=A0ABV0PGP9_9TELE
MVPGSAPLLPAALFVGYPCPLTETAAWFTPATSGPSWYNASLFTPPTQRAHILHATVKDFKTMQPSPCLQPYFFSLSQCFCFLCSQFLKVQGTGPCACILTMVPLLRLPSCPLPVLDTVRGYLVRAGFCNQFMLLIIHPFYSQYAIYFVFES